MIRHKIKRYLLKFNTDVSRRISGNDGFSLIEIVVALFLGSLIMMMVYSAHKTVISSINSITQNTQFYENVNLAVRRISRDIECSIFRADNKNITFSGDNNVNQPSSGWTEFVTVNRIDKAASGDISSEFRETDVKSVKYSLRQDKKYHGLFFLMRSEMNLYNIKSDDDSSRIRSFESMLLENVTDIEFFFWTGSEWNHKWDSPTSIPTAVKIILKVKDFKSKDHVFTFISMPIYTRTDMK